MPVIAVMVSRQIARNLSIIFLQFNYSVLLECQMSRVTETTFCLELGLSTGSMTKKHNRTQLEPNQTRTVFSTALWMR